MKKVSKWLLLILVMVLVLPLSGSGQNPGDLGSVAVDGLNSSMLSSAVARAIEKEKKRPFEEWPAKAYLVFLTEGQEFTYIFYPEAAKKQVRVEYQSKETKKGRKWSLNLWQGPRRVRTEGCAWKGDQVVGVFLFKVTGGRGEEVQMWGCSFKPPDKSFYDTSSNHPAWTDVLPPEEAQATNDQRQ